MTRRNRLVCPGFIDVNNHSDTYWRIFNNPDLESLVYQGITTIIGGNCGSSLAPLADSETIASIQKWSNIKQVNVNWLTMPEFFEAVSNCKLSVNFATLVGHGTLRRGILKDEMRAPEPKEMAFIEKMLSKSHVFRRAGNVERFGLYSRPHSYQGRIGGTWQK